MARCLLPRTENHQGKGNGNGCKNASLNDWTPRVEMTEQNILFSSLLMRWWWRRQKRPAKMRNDPQLILCKGLASGEQEVLVDEQLSIPHRMHTRTPIA